MYLVFVLKWVKSLIVRNLMNLTDETWGGWYLLLQLALPEGISSDEIYFLVQKVTIESSFDISTHLFLTI